LGRIIHVMSRRAWRKEMRQLLGEKVDFAVDWLRPRWEMSAVLIDFVREI
jgi:hypothetical protein